MGPIAVGFGVALTVLGIWAYIATDRASITALIPAFFGLALVLLGRLAANDKLRMHVMHAAALIGLIGLAAPLVMLIRGMMREDFAWGVRQTALAGMAGLCGVFLVLCVKSFIDARRARKQAESTNAPK